MLVLGVNYGQEVVLEVSVDAMKMCIASNIPITLVMRRIPEEKGKHPNRVGFEEAAGMPRETVRLTRRNMTEGPATPAISAAQYKMLKERRAQKKLQAVGTVPSLGEAVPVVHEMT